MTIKELLDEYFQGPARNLVGSIWLAAGSPITPVATTILDSSPNPVV